MGWRRLQQEGDREDRDEYLDKYTLSRNSLRFVNGQLKAHMLVSYNPLLVIFLHKMTFSCAIINTAGLISQFSENLHEAGLVSRASECHRHMSLYNEHSNQDGLLKAVLLAGLFPNLIQVHGNVSE